MTSPLNGSSDRVVTTTYDAGGQVLSVTAPALTSGDANRVATYTYDARGWTATYDDPFGNLSTYTYSPTGMILTQTNPSGGGSGSGGSGDLARFTYDALDRRVAVTDANGNTTTTLYDGVGHVVSVTDPNGNTTSYAYDSREQLTTVTDALGHSTVYGYDLAGNETSVTDANSNTTTYQYDALNRVTTTIDARGDATVLTFDSGGRNTVVKDPNGNLTTFAYDAADRLISKTTPTATGGAASSTYAYDLAGELTAKTDRDGRQTTYSYDSGGRLTGETWHNANGTTQDTITYAYNVDGQMTGASDSSATITMVYDSGGRLASEATSGPSGTQPLVTLTYGYDAFGNKTSLTDSLSGSGWSGQGVTSYSYDAAFRLTTETQTFGGNAGPQVLFGYDPANRLTSIDRTIDGSGTSVNSTYSYDSANRLTTIVDQAGSTGLATFVYGYDSGNRLTSGNLTEGTYTYDATYGYDHSNELTAVTATLDGSAANESYSFDSGGNRTMTGYSTGADNALTASPGFTYTYDNEGNMTSKTQTSGGAVWTYGYDDRNRLTSVVEKNSGGSTIAQATYVYDALDRRIGIDDNSTQTWTVFDGSNPYADFNASGTLTNRYLSGAAVDEIFARTSASGTSAWYLTDNLGSVRDLVSSSGLILDHLAYDSFGNVTLETSPSSGDRFKYAGMEYDPTTGDDYDRARYYTSFVGRFINQDPMGLTAGDSNIYRYVENTPINLIDPSGEFIWVPVGIGIAAWLYFFNNTPSLNPPSDDQILNSSMQYMLTAHIFPDLDDRNDPLFLSMQYIFNHKGVLQKDSSKPYNHTDEDIVAEYHHDHNGDHIFLRPNLFDSTRPNYSAMVIAVEAAHEGVHGYSGPYTDSKAQEYLAVQTQLRLYRYFRKQYAFRYDRLEKYVAMNESQLRDAVYSKYPGLPDTSPKLIDH